MPLQDSLESPVNPSRYDLRVSHTVAVLAVGLSLRLLVIWTVVAKYPPRWLFTRGMEMGLLAKSILAGQGLSSPFGGNTGPTAIVAPVYPILVGVVFKVFGEFSLSSAIVIMSAQTVLNLVTIWLIMHVALRLFNQKTATFAGLIWACSPPLIWMPTILWETSLSCCLLVGFLALLLRYRAVPDLGPASWARLGAYCGITALVNPALLPSLIGISLWQAFAARRRNATGQLLAALAFALIFAPWPIRNARVFHAFIPLRTTVGFELWMGNREGATGFLDESLFPMFNQNELADYKERGEVDYSNHKSELAKRYIAEYPGTFVRMTALRTIRFWSGTGSKNGSTLFAVHALFTTLLGFSGLALLFRARRFGLAILFAFPLILFPLPYMITHAEFRYRLVIDPLLTILCAFAATEMYRLAIRDRHQLAGAQENLRAALAATLP